jgi:hypothetical protein
MVFRPVFALLYYDYDADLRYLTNTEIVALTVWPPGP